MKAVEALAAALAFLGRRKTGGANRCHAILRTMFGCAIAWGHQPETTWIPYNGVVRYRHPPPGPNSRAWRRGNRLAVGLLRATFFLETIQCPQPLKSKR